MCLRFLERLFDEVTASKLGARGVCGSFNVRGLQAGGPSTSLLCGRGWVSVRVCCALATFICLCVEAALGCCARARLRSDPTSTGVRLSS